MQEIDSVSLNRIRPKRFVFAVHFVAHRFAFFTVNYKFADGKKQPHAKQKCKRKIQQNVFTAQRVFFVRFMTKTGRTDEIGTQIHTFVWLREGIFPKATKKSPTDKALNTGEKVKKNDAVFFPIVLCSYILRFTCSHAKQIENQQLKKVLAQTERDAKKNQIGNLWRIVIELFV